MAIENGQWTRVWLGVVATVGALQLSGCTNGCYCGHEGSVTYSATSAARDDDAAYVTGRLQRAPCCEDTTTRTRSYRLDARSGAFVSMQAPAEAESVALPTGGETSVFLDFPAAGTQMEISVTASTSVSLALLRIGTLRCDCSKAMGQSFCITSLF